MAMEWFIWASLALCGVVGLLSMLFSGRREPGVPWAARRFTRQGAMFLALALTGAANTLATYDIAPPSARMPLLVVSMLAAITAIALAISALLTYGRHSVPTRGR